jgi:hypothetical protein
LLDNAAILCKEFNVERTSNQTVQCQSIANIANLEDSILIFDNASTGGYFNTCDTEYNATTGIYTAGADNNISLQGLLNFDLLYTESSLTLLRIFKRFI